MKTYNHLIEKIADYQNIESAYRKARLGRQFCPEVLKFTDNLEENLIRIKNELLYGMYQTGRYREFMIYDPKQRLVMALPFYDRVVHHAICNIIEPLFDRKFIYDSYACRMGKGVISGVLRLENYILEATRKNKKVFVLKGDIKKFFYSINHHVLKKELRRTVKCKSTLKLLDGIIKAGGSDDVGMPIGNLTSQLFANVYLNPLDHFVKEELCQKRYIRYMDDFVILSSNKDLLWDIYHAIKSFIERLALTLNSKTSIFPLNRGIDFLGFRHFSNHRLLRKRNIYKTRRKFKKFSRLYRQGQISFNRIDQSVKSFLGHAKWARSYNVRKKLLNHLILQRGV